MNNQPIHYNETVKLKKERSSITIYVPYSLLRRKYLAMALKADRDAFPMHL